MGFIMVYKATHITGGHHPVLGYWYQPIGEKTLGGEGMVHLDIAKSILGWLETHPDSQLDGMGLSTFTSSELFIVCRVSTWICLRGPPKNKTYSLNRFPSHGGFSIGKITNHRPNKPRSMGIWLHWESTIQVSNHTRGIPPLIFRNHGLFIRGWH